MEQYIQTVVNEFQNVPTAKAAVHIFHYSSYWGMWARRLKQYDEGEIKGIVEVNLTPIPNCVSSTWTSDVIPVVFRIHGTPDDRNDRNEKELPQNIRDYMIANIGEKLTNKLLAEDWLSLIDLKLLRRNSNGGCRFELCRKYNA